MKRMEQPHAGKMMYRQNQDGGAKKSIQSNEEIGLNGKYHIKQKKEEQVPEEYGIVFSLKSNFGFIQPFNGEEQIFFSEREFYDNMLIGDKVGYRIKNGNKGLLADGIRFLTNAAEDLNSSIKTKGKVTRLPNRHRSGYGTIFVEQPTNQNDRTAEKPSESPLDGKEIYFKSSDIQANGSLFNRTPRLDVGNFVEFNATIILDSQLILASNVVILKPKVDLNEIDSQIERMIQAGAKREQGVVSTIRKGEFGFIKVVDRKNEVYFRVDDHIKAGKIVEGSEVDFFIIAEVIKGKLSDRALLLKKLPDGTVQFELTIASHVKGIVISDSFHEQISNKVMNYNEDTPVGILQLFESIDISVLPHAETNRRSMQNIELWQRCLPDGLIIRIGDTLQVDVHYYRPEKLYFARHVQVVSYRKIGRELGYLCQIKEGAAFGFIHSNLRNNDVYFKIESVIDANGQLLHDHPLLVDTAVSYEVMMEDSYPNSQQSNNKLRAIRVQILDLDEGQNAIELNQNKKDGNKNEVWRSLVTQSRRSKYLLKTDCMGSVLRVSTKKDMVGLIRLNNEYVLDLKRLEFIDQDILNGLKEFMDCPALDEVVLSHQTIRMSKEYVKVILNHCPSIGFEYITDQNHSGQEQTFRIWKMKELEYKIWKESAMTLYGPKVSNDGKHRNNMASTQVDPDTTIQFFKEDYITSDEYGPLGVDLKVIFDVHWNVDKQRKVAKCVRLLDEPVEDQPGFQSGVIEVVVDKSGGKYGFIRCIPSDEKLFWHLTGSASGSNSPPQRTADELHEGTEVVFTLRRRGGLRCAVNVVPYTKWSSNPSETIQTDSVQKYHGKTVLEAKFTGLVVDLDHVILLDDVDRSIMYGKYITPMVMMKLLQCNLLASSNQMNYSKTSSQSWEKKSMKTIDPAVDPPTDSHVNEIEPVFSENKIEIDANQEMFKAKYFPVLPRCPLLIEKEENLTVSVGDMVDCRCVMEWATSRIPTSIKVMNRLEGNESNSVLIKKGKITRMKYRIRSSNNNTASHESEEVLPMSSDLLLLPEPLRSSLPIIDFVEIVDLSSVDISAAEYMEHLINQQQVVSTGGMDGKHSNVSNYYYCQYSEIVFDSNGRDMIRVGDEVDFQLLPNWSSYMALNVRLVQKTSFSREIAYNGKPSHGQVESKPLLAPSSIITMAMGPPSDSSIGFPSGWREKKSMETAENVTQSDEISTICAAVDVKILPWAHLLKHLH